MVYTQVCGGIPAADAGAPTEAERQENAQELEVILWRAGCTERQVRCFCLRLAERLSAEGVAERLGLGLGVVYRELRAARRRMHELADSDPTGEKWEELVGHLVCEDIEETHQVTGASWWRPASLLK